MLRLVARAQGQDALTGMHGNTALALMLGAQRRFEVTGETHFTALTQRFVDLVVQRRSCAGLSLGPCSG